MNVRRSKAAFDHLNLCDDGEVAALAKALNCLPLDIFNAVAAVGDQIVDIRDYICKSFGPASKGDPQAFGQVRTSDELPPVWPMKDDSPRRLLH